MDGRRRSFTMKLEDETVLDGAARAGIELPFSCRAGVCSTCRTKVVRGEVAMAQNYALEDWELEQGYVLACQSHVQAAHRWNWITTRNEGSSWTEADVSYQNILFEVRDGIARLTLEPARAAEQLQHRDARRGARGARHTPAHRRRACWSSPAPDAASVPARTSTTVPSPRAPRRRIWPQSIEKHYKPLVLTLRALPLPVIAAVNGVAAGAGANLALACDLVIAARSAVFVQAFAKLGLVPDSGGTWFLPRLVGTARALGLALLGDKLPAEQARGLGPDLALRRGRRVRRPRSRTWRGSFAAAPTRGLARTKQAIYEGLGRTLAAAARHRARLPGRTRALGRLRRGRRRLCRQAPAALQRSLIRATPAASR